MQLYLTKNEVKVSPHKYIVSKTDARRKILYAKMLEIGFLAKKEVGTTQRHSG
jgi:hypothetical protein